MKIAIVGGGSIGLLFATYLTENYDITVYTRSKKQASNLNERGVTLKKNNKIFKSCSIAAKPFDKWNNNEDLTIITVKQYSLQNIIDKIALKENNKGNSLLFLQNGMGHIPLLEQLHGWNILLGVVEHGALRTANNIVQHTGVGVTKIANYSSNEVVLQRLLTNKNKNFLFVFDNDYEQMLLQKLIVNIMINPLTALLEVRNGLLIENEYYFKTFKLLYEEVIDIFDFPNKTEMFNHVINVCEQTSSNKSSMLKDIIEGRQTEVDAILGYALTVAKQKQLSTPLIEALYMLIKGKQLKGEVY